MGDTVDSLDHVFDREKALQKHKDMLCDPETCEFCLAEKDKEEEKSGAW